MKLCPKCNTSKDTECFNKARKYKDGLQIYCKECTRSQSKSYYSRNKDKHCKEIGRRRKQYIKFIKSKLDEIRISGCCLCDEKEIICLDFHHKDPTRKEAEIATLSRRGWSWKRIKNEIDKCVVVCSNCHRKIHAGLICLKNTNMD
jgi:hypothetical protein